MKYWFFDGNDVIGPFTASDLVANRTFSATSLICPEHFSDDGDHWQPAVMFADVKALLAQNTAPNTDNSAAIEEEMDSLLKERSPLSFDETPTDGPDLEIPKKPSRPGPIEDYFNNIQGGDLGNILGMPDPNDNSDVDLAHALEKQLAKTSSTRRERLENTNLSEPAPDPLESTHHVATVTEVFGEKPQKMPTLPSATLPTLAPEEPAATADTAAQELTPLDQRPQEELPAAMQTQQKLVQTTDFTNQPEEIIPTDSTPEESPQIIPDPALLRAEKVEVNSVRARLKQTKEMKDFLNRTQNSHLKKQYKTQRKILVMLLAALAIMIALFCITQFKPRQERVALPPSAVSTQAVQQELLDSKPVTPVPAPPIALSPGADQGQKALGIVQNYALSGNRGSVINYLNKIYQTQLSQGYTGTWGVEPLHKNTYIVKYQLTKTRKEPIIYVFQVDVASGKLTGALNNITLDLVGKI